MAMTDHFTPDLPSAATQNIRRYAIIITEQVGNLDPEDDYNTIASAPATISLAADKILEHLPQSP